MKGLYEHMLYLSTILLQSSVVVHFGFSCSESVDVAQERTRRSTMRKLLNAEKAMFRTDAAGRVIMPEQGQDNEETCDQVVVTLSATPWGHFTSNHPRDRFYYDIGMSTTQASYLYAWYLRVWESFVMT